MTFRGEERGSLVALPWLKSLAQRHPPATVRRAKYSTGTC